MKVAKIYSHLNGYEWIMYRKPNLWKEIETAIHAINPTLCKTKISKEVRMKGKLLFDPATMNNLAKTYLESQGWKESRTSYWVTDDYKIISETMTKHEKEQKAAIASSGKTPIKSSNQVDFVKDRVAVEVQFGKYSFVAYDMFVKHMAFYVGSEIDLGIEIVPMKSMQAEMSSGPPYYEGALYDLVRQGRGVPAVPLILIGIAP